MVDHLGLLCCGGFCLSVFKKWGLFEDEGGLRLAAKYCCWRLSPGGDELCLAGRKLRVLLVFGLAQRSVG